VKNTTEGASLDVIQYELDFAQTPRFPDNPEGVFWQPPMPFSTRTSSKPV
jgi:hypothetical protein